MGTNYKTIMRTRETIARSADDLRAALGIPDICSFNIVQFARRMIGQKIGSLGKLSLKLYPNLTEFAYVDFNPLTLHVDNDIWDEAELGEPKARFIIAHELGHITLHRFHRQEFSEEEKSRLKSFPMEEQTEHQANWFAADFLAPDRLIDWSASDLEICQKFGFPREYIFLKREVAPRQRVRFPSGFCDRCGHFLIGGNSSI